MKYQDQPFILKKHNFKQLPRFQDFYIQIKMMERFLTLESFSDQCWRSLLNGAAKKKDPLRLPVLGTVHENTPHLRTVVLRKVDVLHRRLIFYTDIRSAKVVHLQQHPQLTCLFYHPKKQLQIRTEGTIHLHHQDELATLHWDHIPIFGRKTYAALQVPGTPIDEATDGLPDFWNNEMDVNKSEYAFANFAVIICTVEKMEGLLLHSEGHQRAAFTWAEGQWQSKWLIP